ncbi:RecA-like DNA recombinase [Microbacterium phage Namago]|nr:RecA-like DNA recombinase [Microbacterium phage Namago]
MNQPAPYRLEAVQPPSHVRYAHTLGRGMLTFQQIEELVKGINSLYVQAKQGKSYLAQHQARAEMNRIFGYGNWDVIEGEPHMMYEYQEAGTGQNASKMYWIAGYRASVTVNVRDLWGMPVCTVTGTHAEQNVKLPDRGEANAMAITSVLSYALRRALINLGDRFGLGLYNGGSTAPHGQYTIQQYEGQLGTWVPNTITSQVAAPVVTHETIKAEPVISDDGTNPNWVDPTQQPAQAPVQQQMAPQQVQQQAPQVMQQAGAPQQQQQAYVQQQGPTPQGDGTVQGMQQAAQQQAYARQQYTQQQFAVDPSMAARLQQGFKQDDQGGQG